MAETPSSSLSLSALERLAPRLGAGDVTVANLKRLSAGASQELWRFELMGRAGEVTPLIVRRAPGGDRQSVITVGLEAEAAIMRVAADGGVPVPAIRHVFEPTDGLGRGFVMDVVEGETLGHRIANAPALADARTRLARECGAALARIHALPLDRLPPLKAATPAELVAAWEASYRAAGRVRPVFELAFRWLETHLPPPRPPVLLHGDFRNGNLMVGPDGLRAVLDWELAHLGDPAEEFGWICVPSWRFGQLDKPVGGFGSREDMIAGYEAEGGGAVDRAALQWWDIFGVIRWGIMCAGMPAAFRSADPSVERAVIARRASETEIDLLRLLDAA
jgi:aminoglycoside phosphotransferase (APT) family kinase protein